MSKHHQHHRHYRRRLLARANPDGPMKEIQKIVREGEGKLFEMSPEERYLLIFEPDKLTYPALHMLSNRFEALRLKVVIITADQVPGLYKVVG